MAYNTKQILTSTAVIFILVVFPLISYYYLNSGLNFRKNIEKEISVKDSIKNFSLKLVEENKSLKFQDFDDDNLVLLLKDGEDNTFRINENSTFYNLIRQFKNREDLIILIYDDSFEPENNNAFLSLIKKNELILARTSDMRLVKNWPDSLINKASAAMIDENGLLRSYYDINSDENMNNLIEHISVSLPELTEKRYRSSKDLK